MEIPYLWCWTPRARGRQGALPAPTRLGPQGCREDAACRTGCHIRAYAKRAGWQCMSFSSSMVSSDGIGV